MSTVTPTDKVLVNRAGVDHSAPADMSTVQDTDLLLINRAGVDYKCTFADWKNSQSKPPDVGAVTLADVAGGDRFTSVAFPVSATMTDDGIPTSTKKLKAYVEGTLVITPKTSAITNVSTSTTPAANTFVSVNTGGFSANRGPDKGFDGLYTSGTGVTYCQSDTSTDSIITIDMRSFNVDSDVTPVVIYNIGSDVVTNNNAARYQEWVGSIKSEKTGRSSAGQACPPGLGILQEINIRSDVANQGFSGITVGGRVLVAGVAQATLTLTDNTDLANFRVGDAVTEVGNGDDGTGVVSAVDAVAVPPTMKLSGPGGTWDVGSAVKGPPKPSASAKLFCKLDAAGAVSDLQSADPGFTAWTPAGAGPYTGTVTFPATLPTGNAPDADLPAGTTVTVEVEASNTAGTDSATSNTVTPS